MTNDVRELERRIRRWRAAALISLSCLGLVLLAFLVCGGLLVVRSQQERMAAERAHQEAMLQRERAEAAMQQAEHERRRAEEALKQALQQRDQAEKARREAEEAAKKTR